MSQKYCVKCENFVRDGFIGKVDYSKIFRLQESNEIDTEPAKNEDPFDKIDLINKASEA